MRRPAWLVPLVSMSAGLFIFNTIVTSVAAAQDTLILTDNSPADNNGDTHVSDLIVAFVNAGANVTTDFTELTNDINMPLSLVTGWDVVIVVTVNGERIDAGDIPVLQTAVNERASNAFLIFADACGVCNRLSASDLLPILNVAGDWTATLGSADAFGFLATLTGPYRGSFVGLPTYGSAAYAPLVGVPADNILYSTNAAASPGPCAVVAPGSASSACVFFATDVTAFWVTGGYPAGNDLAAAYLDAASDCPLVPDFCYPTTALYFNTGWNQTNGIPTSLGEVDNEWMVVEDSPSFPVTQEPRPAFAVAPHGLWSPAQDDSKWISSFPTAADDINGRYEFEYRFCLNGTAGASLSMAFRADDWANVFLNGSLIGQTDEPGFYGPAFFLTVSYPSTPYFLDGENVLRVDVYNTHRVAMGFNVVGTIHGNLPQYHYCCTDSASGLLGKVWQDFNGNGVRDGAEKGVGGWTVNVAIAGALGPPLRTTKTDGLGNYYFLGLAPGSYIVQPIYLPLASATTPMSYTTVLDTGEITPYLDFGFRKDSVAFNRHPTVAVAPNPSNPGTTITFSVIDAGTVSLIVYDVTGRPVRRLMNETLDVGTHSKEWDGRDDSGSSVSSGVYFCNVVINGISETRRITLLK